MPYSYLEKGAQFLSPSCGDTVFVRGQLHNCPESQKYKNLENKIYFSHEIHDLF